MRARAAAVTLVTLAVLALVPACRQKPPGEVDLTIAADGSLDPGALASIRALEVVISGVASADRTYAVDQPFASGRSQRLVIRPPVSSGTLAISIVARDAANASIATGGTAVDLSASGAVAAQVILGGVGAGDLGPPDAGSPDLAAPPGPVLTVVAGHIGGIGYVDGSGAAARFNNPRGIAFVGGNLYVADMNNHVIRKIALATGAVSTVAGKALEPGSSDGVGAAARFNRPHGVCADGAGNLFISDMRNDTLRQVVLATGTVTTLAGSPGQSGSSDSTGAAARFAHPHGLACDRAGNVFVADTYNHTIRQVVIATGAVTTLAGSAGQASFADGTGAAARFNAPHDLAFENGSLYVADTHNHAIRQIDVASGTVTTLAGAGGQAGFLDGTGGNARFSSPRGVFPDGAGNLWVADSDNTRVRKLVEATASVTTLAGQSYGSNDGSGAGASFANPCAVTSDGAGTLYLLDAFGHAVRKVVTASAAVTTLAGLAGADGNSDGIGAAATFRRPHGLAIDGTTLFVLDKMNNGIRKIDLPTGNVSTLAGSGQAGSMDGVGATARFNGPFGAVADGAGKLYVSDGNNHTIRVIDVASGAVTTIAGSAGQVGASDDVGAAARFNTPAGLAYAPGVLYIADLNNHTIRKLDLASAAVTTLAGSAGQVGGSDGIGAAARFNNPNGVALVGGTLYIVDESNHAVRALVLATGAVTTLAGSAGMSGVSDGTGAAARFDMPHAIVADGAGSLFVADTRGHTVRKIAIASGAVTTYVGAAGVAAVQIGPLPAGLNTPCGLALGSGGALYIASAHENAILLAR